MRKAVLMLVCVLTSFGILFSQSGISIDVSPNKIKYDSKRGIIYATIKGESDQYSNSLIAIQPNTGTVLKNKFIGSEPTDFVFTSDSNFLYIMFDETPFVKKMDLNSFNIVQEINLGIDPYHGAYYGKSLAVLDNNNAVVIVSRKQKGVSPDFGGVAVYSNGKKLPKETKDHHGPEYLVNTYNDTLFAYDNNLFTLIVEIDSGVSILNEYNSLGLSGDVKYDGGLLFTNRGIVFNPYIPAQIGKFPLEDSWARYPCAPGLYNDVFFGIVSDNNINIDIYKYDRTTFTKKDKITIGGIISNDFHIPELSEMIRYGNSGLAFVVFDDYSFSQKKSFLYLYNNSTFINPNLPLSTPQVSNNSLEFSFYPNPAEDVITLKEATGMATQSNVEIANLSGQVLYLKSDVKMDEKIDISFLESGLYIVTLKDLNGKVVGLNKLIVR